MYKFYYPDGSECKSVDDFIDYYSKAYYLFNNRDAEDYVIKLENSKSLDKIQVFRILAWKMGRISRMSFEHSIVYHKGCNEESLCLKNYKNLDVNNIKEALNELIGKEEEYNGKSDEDILKMWFNILKNIEGLGNTYIITLLHFYDTRFPIYDVYSDVASQVISKNLKFKDVSHLSENGDAIIANSDISGKTQKSCISHYNNYKETLIKIFGKKQYSSRKVDQALWTYGHLFYCNIQNFKNREKVSWF